MGIPDGAHTHGSGGGFGGEIIAALFLLGLIAVLAGPVAAAVGALIHILLVTVISLAGVAALAVGGRVWWQLAHRSQRPALYGVEGAPSLQQPRRRELLPEPQKAIAPEVHVHHHWHGVNAEDVAAILAQHGRASTPS
jgi:hypothetical protein